MGHRICYILTFLVLLGVTNVAGQSIVTQVQAIESLSDNEVQKISKLKHLLAADLSSISLDSQAFIEIHLAKRYFAGAISMDSAIWFLDDALNKVGQRKGDIYYEANYLKGFYYRKWDKYEESLDALNKVLQSDDPNNQYRATVQLGKLYKDRGEFALCFKHYDSALKLVSHDLKRRVRVFQYISFAYSVMGTDHGQRECIRWLDSLESGLNQIGDVIRPDYPALIEFNRGLAYQALGEMDQAIWHVDRSEEHIMECCDQPDFLGLIQEFQGQVALERGEYEKGIDKIKSSIQLFQYSFDLGRSEGLAGTYHLIAQAYYDWNKPDSALKYIDLAIQDRIYGLNNRQTTDTISFENAVLMSGEKNYLIQDFLMKGDIYELLNNNELQYTLTDAALKNYLLAEEVLNVMSKFHFDEKTKLFWRKDAKDIYYHIIRLLIRKGNIEDAFLYVEKSKYVLLEEHLKKNDIDRYIGNDALMTEYKELQRRLSMHEEAYQNSQIAGGDLDSTRAKILDLRGHEEDLLHRIYTANEDVYKSLFDWDTPIIGDIQNKLKSEQKILISYFLHDEVSYAIKLNGKEIIYIELPNMAELDQKILEFHNIIGQKNNGKSDQFQDAAYELYSILLGRLISKDSRDIVVIPDRLISILPLDILVAEKKKNVTYKNMNYLIHDFNISLLLNAKSYLKENTVTSVFDREAIVLAPSFANGISEANYDVSRSDLAPLNGAKGEVEMISSLFKSTVLDKHVGEERFNAEIKKSAGVLHIATHAILDNQNPDRSRLVLENTGSNKHDDLIHLFELKNKKINTDLVVLSACNTGSGQWHAGEGISSLGIAFKYAGSPNIMNTLWAIPDYSSAVLMDKYYHNLSEMKGKRSALHNAKVKFLSQQPPKYVHPYYWAGYVYYGDDAPLRLSKEPSSFEIMYQLIAIAIFSLIFITIFKRSK